jgi:hypothetical protein
MKTTAFVSMMVFSLGAAFTFEFAQRGMTIVFVAGIFIVGVDQLCQAIRGKP